ncbi:MAG: flagellar hook-associated protein FlgK [Phycisphaerales bacterium]
MSLLGAFEIGRSGLTAGQLGTQVTGNNIANLSTPGYSRQTLDLTAVRDARYGNALYGRGVQLAGVRRSVDQALQARLNTAIASESGANQTSLLLGNVENTVANLQGANVSTQLNVFFNAWSQLSQFPAQATSRTAVVQQGQALASFLHSTRSSLVGLQQQIDTDLGANVTQANDLLGQIATLNQQISISEGGNGQANNLRDQRDHLVSQLSQYINVNTVEQPSGTLDVLIGSVPLVINGQSRGLRLVQQSVQTATGTTSRVAVSTIVTPEELRIDPNGGAIGSLLANRGTLVGDTLDRLDRVSAQLIDQVNRAYSVGYSGTRQPSYTGSLSIQSSDRSLAINDTANQTFSTLPFAPQSGSFLVTVTDSTGVSRTTRIAVDLDGVDNTGAPGTANDTTTDGIATALNAVTGLTATYNASGQLVIAAGSGSTVSFAEDTSGVLATLGVNTYFTGTSAASIAVRDEIVAQPNLLNVGQVVSGNPVDNAVAMAIGGVGGVSERRLGALDDSTISQYWDSAVQAVGVRSAASQTTANATKTVRESIEAQRTAIAGVSTDEEAINLIGYQRLYEASARFVSVVNDMTKTLLQLV